MRRKELEQRVADLEHLMEQLNASIAGTGAILVSIDHWRAGKRPRRAPKVCAAERIEELERENEILRRQAAR